MGDLYWIGVLLGLGAGAGLLFTAGLAGMRYGMTAAAVLAATFAGIAGLAVGSWPVAVAGVAGAAAGVFGGGQLVAGSLRRGGTRGGTLLLVGLGALAVALLAWIPGVGYLEALALPVLGVRLRSRAPKRYAGLRILDP